jgi:hypothetical protein
LFGVGRTQQKIQVLKTSLRKSNNDDKVKKTQMSFGHTEQGLLLQKKREISSHRACNVRPSVRLSQNNL